MARVNVKVKTTEIDRGFRKAVKQIEEANGRPYVKIGILDAQKHKGSKLSVAQIGAVHEFGAKFKGKAFGKQEVDIEIPERSWLRSTMDENARKYRRITNGMIESIIANKMTVQRALGLLGLMITRDMKKKITDIDDPPLSPATIARKLRKAKGRAKDRAKNRRQTIRPERIRDRLKKEFKRFRKKFGSKKKQKSDKPGAFDRIKKTGNPLVDTGQLRASVRHAVVMPPPRNTGVETKK